ncbi:MAG: hypothetical protein MUF18_06195 [Fimbriiglobus sp.]|jgi:hypothetical protein|nr:hypothetical protein [Fimbriiglobus sp.]
MLRKMLAVAVVAVSGLAFAAEIKSGPQAGEKVPGPFHPLNVNGESAGKKACLFCKYGDSPVAMVFARNPECEGTKKLIAKLEEATAANSKSEMGAFVVFLSDDDKTEGKLKKLAEDAKLKNVTLAVDNPAGPKEYNVAKDADVTVVFYTDRTVKVNKSFAKGTITDKDIEALTKDMSKILPEKK